MYDELIARLRNAAQLADKGLLISPSVCLEAADAIEELSKRVPKAPHGRLIDADELEKDGWWAVLRTKTASSENLEGIMEEYMRLDSVRTVIPAEEEN